MTLIQNSWILRKGIIALSRIHDLYQETRTHRRILTRDQSGPVSCPSGIYNSSLLFELIWNTRDSLLPLLARLPFDLHATVVIIILSYAPPRDFGSSAAATRHAHARTPSSMRAMCVIKLIDIEWLSYLDHQSHCAACNECYERYVRTNMMATLLINHSE